MKKHNLLIMAAIASSLAGGAYAATTAEDVADDAKAVERDNANIDHQDSNIAVNRKEKAAAKARGDVVDQASQSVQIGANKAAKGVHEIKKDLNEKELDEDTEKLKKGE